MDIYMLRPTVVWINREHRYVLLLAFSVYRLKSCYTLPWLAVSARRKVSPNGFSMPFQTSSLLWNVFLIRIIRLSPFANRLSTDAPPHVQRVRCLANYQAPRFSDPIATVSELLVARMKRHSAKTGGKYVSCIFGLRGMGFGRTSSIYILHPGKYSILKSICLHFWSCFHCCKPKKHCCLQRS